MFMNFLNFLFWKRTAILSCSFLTPPKLLGGFTSIKNSGIPFMRSVMSGRNESSSFLQGNSVTTWKLLLSKFSKSTSLAPDSETSLLKKARPKSSFSNSSEISLSNLSQSTCFREGLIRSSDLLKMSGKILVDSSQLAPFKDKYSNPNLVRWRIAGSCTLVFSLKFDIRLG